MIGDSITVTLGGSGGTAVVCPKVNQDNYSSTYLKKGTSYDVKVVVRHLNENVKSGAVPMERHILTITQTVHPSETYPQGLVREATITVRNDTIGSAEADVVDVGEALTFYASTSILTKLFGWES